MRDAKYRMTLGPKKPVKTENNLNERKVTLCVKLASSRGGFLARVHLGLHQTLLIQNGERNDPLDGISPRHGSTN